MAFSKAILGDDIWSASAERDARPSAEMIQLHYKRARSLCEGSGLKIHDIVNLSDKFWDFHFDLVAARDMTSFIIATIHMNLCIGTLGALVNDRPDLHPVLAKLERFEICGEFMLTEIGHGLDARNLETTAQMLPDGSFDLHTPGLAAAKAMPPTTPEAGIPRVAVVFARLMANGDDLGVKPFLVWLSESDRMLPGITSRALPIRPGTKPLDHSITSFHHVHLPQGSLLGSPTAVTDARAEFLDHIRRVPIGTLALSIMGISALKVGCYIAATYSQRRHIEDTATGKRIPLLTLSTQHGPIITGLVFAKVLEVYARWTIKEFRKSSLDQRVRHGLAVIFKALVMRSVKTLDEISQRCGWQGLFRHNQISELALTFLGNSIAEGDTLVLCIRLASELLTNRYALHSARDPGSALARHEQGVFSEASARFARIQGGHRSPEFGRHILPRSRQLVEAIGQRMAYEAAQESGLDGKILDFFEFACIADDASWYVEHCGLRRASIFERHTAALHGLLPLVTQLLSDTSIKPYVTAPILDEGTLAEFVEGLPKFQHSVQGETAEGRHNSVKL